MPDLGVLGSTGVIRFSDISADPTRQADILVRVQDQVEVANSDD